MQVESPADIITAYTNQIAWLERRLEEVKRRESEASPLFGTIQSELDRLREALGSAQRVLNSPTGRWVEVLQSKVAGLRGKVGRVNYVNTDRGYATVAFDGGVHSHSLSLKNLRVVDMPVPSDQIPAPGMVVRFKQDPDEYLAMSWDSDRVYAASLGSVLGGRFYWKSRNEIESVNGKVYL